MSPRGILVGIDASAAGERLLRSALGLARERKAYLAAAYSMRKIVPQWCWRVPRSTPARYFRRAGGLTAPGDPAADPFPQISHEAQIADGVQHLFWNELQREGVYGEWHLFASNTVGFSIWQSRSI